MIGVQRDEAQKGAVPVAHGANLLAQPERIDLGTVRRPEVLDRLPAKTRVAVQAVPIEIAPATQRGDDLLELGKLQPEEESEFGQAAIQLAAGLRQRPRSRRRRASSPATFPREAGTGGVPAKWKSTSNNQSSSPAPSEDATSTWSRSPRGSVSTWSGTRSRRRAT